MYKVIWIWNSKKITTFSRISTRITRIFPYLQLLKIIILRILTRKVMKPTKINCWANSNLNLKINHLLWWMRTRWYWRNRKNKSKCFNNNRWLILRKLLYSKTSSILNKMNSWNYYSKFNSKSNNRNSKLIVIMLIMLL